METKNEQEVEETLDLPEVAEGEEDTTDWKAEAQKLREKAIKQRERTKALKQEKADAEAKLVELARGSTKTPTSQAPSGLDETALDFLDVKGITESEDIDVIERVVKRTGQTVRQALKDDYVVAKLEANKQAREVKNAMPTSTKRGGTQSDGFDAALAKAERNPSDLPSDFALRVRVVNALAAKATGNKPAWH